LWGSVGLDGAGQKSITVHGANGAAARMACASLVDAAGPAGACFVNGSSGGACSACHAECDYGGCAGPQATQCLGGCRTLPDAASGACVPFCAAGLVQAGSVCVAAAAGRRQVAAVFAAGRVSGTVFFEQQGRAGAASAWAWRLTGLGGNGTGVRWWVSRLPVVYALDGPAACARVGGDVLVALPGTPPVAGQAAVTLAGGLNLLYGNGSIMGRALVLEAADGSWRACGAIGYPNGAALTTATASFRFPVAGTVTLRQLRDQAGAETTVFVMLERTDGWRPARATHGTCM
jgi:hypothetical protein